MNRNFFLLKSTLGRLTALFFIFSIIFLLCLKTRVNAQLCSSCSDIYRKNVYLYEHYDTDFTRVLYPPTNLTIPGLPPLPAEDIWIIGAEVRFHDFGGDWDYYARAKVIDYDDYSTYYTTDLSNSCVGRHPNSRNCNGAIPCVDVCSPNEVNLHKIYLNNWKTEHQSILELRLQMFRDWTPNEGLFIESITWLYSYCSTRECPSMKPPQVMSYLENEPCYMEGQAGPNVTGLFRIDQISSINPPDLFAIDKIRIKVSSQKMKFTAYEDWTLLDPFPNDGVCFIENRFLNGYFSYPGGNSTGDTPMLRVFEMKRSSPCPGSIYSGEVTIVFSSIESYIPDIESDDWIFTVKAWNKNGDTDTSSTSIILEKHSYSLQYDATETGWGEATIQYSYTLSPGLYVTEDGISLRCYKLPGLESDVLTNCNGRTVLPSGYYDANFSGTHTVSGGVPGVTYRLTLDFEYNCGVTRRSEDITFSIPTEESNSWLMTTYGDTFSNGGYSDLTMRRVTSSEVPSSIKGTAVDGNAAFFSTYIISKNIGKWTSNNTSFQEPDYLLGNYQDKNAEKFQAEGDLYSYLYSLYQSNKTTCDSVVQVHEDEPLGASCSGKNLYFNSDSDITLGEGWNQQPSVDNACLIVSKKNVTIPPSVTNTDAFLLSEGNIVTQAQEAPIGGSGVPENPKITWVRKGPNDGRGVTTTKSVDDIPVILYTYQTGVYSQGKYIARCSNSECTSKTTSPQLSPWANDAALDISPNGNPIFAYAAGWDLRFYACGSPTCSTLSENHEYILDTEVHDLPSLALDPQGRPTIVYTYEYNKWSDAVQDYVCDYRLKLIRCGDKDCSKTVYNNTKRTLVRYTDCTPASYYAKIVFVKNNLNQTRPLLVYKGSWVFDPNNGWYNSQIKVRDCVDMTCGTLGPERKLTRRAGFLDEILDVKVGPDGTPYILYEVETTTRPYTVKHVLIKCADSTCTTSANGAGTFIVTGHEETISNFEIDSNGNPTFTYFIPTATTYPSNIIYLLKCYDNTCSTKSQVQLPGRANNDGIDVILDNNSIPLIVYPVEMSGIQKMRCENIDCQLAVGGSDTMIVMNGSVISGNINFNRSLPDNLNNPAEIFRYDPKYLDIFRDCLGEPYSFKIREYNYITRN